MIFTHGFHQDPTGDDSVRLRGEHCGLDVPGGHVRQQRDDRDQEETEPEHGAGKARSPPCPPCCCPRTIHFPNSVVEELRVPTGVAKTGLLLPRLVGAGPVKQAQGHRGGGGEESVVHPYSPPLVNNLLIPVVVDGQPELDDVEHDVLVEAVEDDLADPAIVPGPMHELQAGRKTEQSDREVVNVCSLQPLVA